MTFSWLYRDVEERQQQVDGARLAGGAHAARRAARGNVEAGELDAEAAVDAVGAGDLEAGIGIGVDRAAAQQNVDAGRVEIAVGDDGHRRRAALEPGEQRLRAHRPATVARPSARALPAPAPHRSPSMPTMPPMQLAAWRHASRRLDPSGEASRNLRCAS